MKTTLKATLVATAIAAFPFASQAAGLGAINVLSGLGQPLRAEIELQATAQELQSLSARVAPANAFRQTGVTYSPFMTGLQFSVETRGNRSVVRVTGDRPVNEPFMEMLVELNWAGGRLLREYTFLLDPVQLTRPPVAAVPVEAPRAAAPAPRPAAAAPRAAAPSGEYRVRRGDTLRGIAGAHRQSNVTLDQMLVALLRQNPQAFDDGNMNRLRAGAIMTIPDQATASAVELAQARREIVAQAADFEAYRSRLSGAVAARPAPAEPAATQESAGEIAPRVEAPAVTDAPQDRVEVSGAPVEGAEDSRLARLQALEEELVAREQSLEEANERLADLERSIRDLQRLIELRNQSLAQMQQQLAAGGEVPAELLLPPVQEATADATETGPATGTPVVEPTPGVVEPLPPVAAEPVPPPEPAAAPPQTIPERAPIAPPAAQPGFLQTLMQDPMLLAGGGGILGLLLLYAGIKRRQRSRNEAEDAVTAAAGDYPSEAHSVFGGKGGQSVDTGSSSVLNTDFSQSGLSSIDADEGVDPVAEADVYMAYGRDAQAEEILLDALKVDSSRAALYVKLLEIYAQRQSARQFESVATEFYAKTGGQGEDWAKVAQMGLKLEPQNPLYQSSPEGVDMEDAPETEPGRDFPRAGAASGMLAAGAVGLAAGAAASNASREGAGVGTDASLSEVDFTTSSPVAVRPDQDGARVEDSDSKTVDADAAQSFDGDAGSDDDTVDFTVLDFDLGDDTTKPDELDERSTPAGVDARARADDASVLDALGDDQSMQFDLDVSDVSTGATHGDVPGARSPKAKQADDTAGSAAGGGLVDDALSEIELPDVQTEMPDDSQALDATVVGNNVRDFMTDDDATDAASPSASSNDLDATMLDRDFLRDVQDDASGVDLEQTEFDNDLLDFDFNLDESADKKPAEKAPPPLDLNGIDLDLDLDLGLDGDAASSAGSGDAGAVTGERAPNPELDQEIDTKLDLARAYEEMGDKEGARELIDEVMREGSSVQREAAARLLERLG
ncbi:FimV/HubP family polar landmark protein [Rhodocyclaceae bacterium SMB388]